LVVAVLIGAGEARAPDEKLLDKAVARGVAALKLMQKADGTWDRPETREQPEKVGTTALAGLTLLECGVSPDDRSVSRAADMVRRAAVNLRHTYSLSLAILFLDRLGEPGDKRLIESMTLRLLGGQTPQGGWSYTCPGPSDEESRLLTELLGRRAPPEEGRTAPRDEARTKEQPRKTVKDLPPEIQEKLPFINRAVVANDGVGRDDNSNTQFAVLALWVGRRYGFPVEEALGRVNARFRTGQNADGGWGYQSLPGEGGRHLGHSTATMTAAGLLGLAVAHGVEAEMKDGKPRLEPAKDVHLKAGLVALGTAIGHPVGKQGGAIPIVGGRSYYFLWSLERVAVALDLETIGGKNWYNWGGEVLLANQRPDGTWQGEYPQGGVDTCFALLFLRRANFARDLTSHFRGKLQDPGRVVLRAGGVGGDALGGATPPGLKSALDPDKPGSPSTADATTDPKPAARPTPRTPEEAAVVKLSDELVRARPEKRKEVLDQLREGKGARYTEALADAIPQLTGDDKRKARGALADRLTRMKSDTLNRYLQDELPEIRRAAALACAMKEEMEHVPGLIDLLRDPEPVVVRAAHAALKELTRQDFGPALGAEKEESEKAVEAWRAWWAKKK
jgi:hypothetical protein